MRVLLLGGTSEAVALGRALADARVDAVLSLAGRTARPAPQPLPTRSGGFGGAAGLAAYLRAERVGAVVDATHPFAARISRNAEDAAASAGVRLLVLRRPPWVARAGDLWTHVADVPAAAAALGPLPRRVFLTTGRLELAPFAAAAWHRYVLRAVEAPDPGLLPGAKIVVARGPFAEADERRLMTEHGIEVVVTKNSGAAATGAKLAAARALGLPVVMVDRPAAGAAETVATVAEAMRWLEARHAALRGA